MTDQTIITPEQEDTDILLSALRKIIDTTPMQFPVVPGGTPTFVRAAQRHKELAAKAHDAVQRRRMQRAIQAELASGDLVATATNAD